MEKKLCFKLYALSRLFTAQYRPVLDKLDLTYPQYLVMTLLWHEKNITVKELGNRLYLDSGTLTPLLKRLEQKGLLARQRDVEDERSVIISLMPAGKEMHQKAGKISETLNRCISIPEKDLVRFHVQLDRLLEQVG